MNPVGIVISVPSGALFGKIKPAGRTTPGGNAKFIGTIKAASNV